MEFPFDDAILAGGGFAFMATGIFNLVHRIRFLLKSKRAAGAIIFVQWPSDDFSHDIKWVTTMAEFSDENGRKHRIDVKTLWSWRFRRPAAGERVTIAYDPLQVDKAMVLSPMNMWLPVCSAMLIGTALILFYGGALLQYARG